MSPEDVARVLDAARQGIEAARLELTVLDDFQDFSQDYQTGVQAGLGLAEKIMIMSISALEEM